MKRYTSPGVLAMEFCSDLRDIQENRYQYGRTNKPIYCIGNYYWCAARKGEKPSKHRDINFEWIEHNSSFADSIEWQIWKCEV